MANNPRLDIEIGAITNELKKGLADARAELRKFSKEASSTDIKTAIQGERFEQEKLRTSILSSRDAMAKLNLEKKKSQQSSVALSGSYREAQQRLTALGKSIREAQGGFSNTSPVVKRQIAEYRQLNDQLKAFDKQMGNNYRNVGNYSDSLLGAIPILNQFAGSAGLAAAGVAGLGKSFSTNLKLDSLKTALKLISGDTENFNKNMSFLRETSDRLGLEFISTAEAFKQWQGAAKFSNITADDSRKIFESVANASAKMKLSTDQVQGAFLALSQMMSKGKVQAEELRGQLGERLPGAFALAAEAMGVSEAELNKMLETGQVMANDFLPKFANQLDKSFGNDKTERIESMQASVSRLKTEFDLLFESERATSFFKTITDGLADVTSRTNKTVSSSSFEEFWLRVSSLATAPVEKIFGLNASGEEADKVAKSYEKIYNYIAKGNASDFFPTVDLSKYSAKVNEVTKEVEKLNTVVTDNTKKTKKSIEDVLGALDGFGGNAYDEKISKINNEYRKLVQSINESSGTANQISDALGVAKAKRDFDLLKISVDRYIDGIKKIKDIYTPTNSVSITGGVTLPTSLPNLAQNAQRINVNRNSNLTNDLSKEFSSTLRRGVSSTLDGLFSSIYEYGNKTYDIEQKYNLLRQKATKEEIKSLNEMERLEKSINSGISNTLSKLGSTLASLSGNLLSSAISTGISKGDFKDLFGLFSGANKAQGYGSLAGLIGSSLSGIIKPNNKSGQGLAGALSGAGTGAALGSIVPGVGTAIGAVAGGLIGALSGIFGASNAKKQEELQKKQLEEQEKQTALMERQAQLTYSSSVIGQQVRGGIVTSVDRDAYGNLVATLKGTDIKLALQRLDGGR